jgi:hypothetical protein
MVGLPPSGYRITAQDGHLASCDGNKQAITPVGVTSRRFLAVSDIEAFCFNSVVSSKSGRELVKNCRIAWPRRRGNITALVALLPTVVDCTHVVGLIMFVWGVKHLSRLSGVVMRFLPVFDTIYDTTV